MALTPVGNCHYYLNCGSTGPESSVGRHKVQRKERDIPRENSFPSEAREIDFDDDPAWDFSFRVQLTLQRATCGLVHSHVGTGTYFM
eukprot:scaffold846_cov168-Amphora_coffeaeformis.AAC.8